MSSPRMSVGSPRGFLIATVLHWIIWTRACCHAHTPYWEVNQCDKAIFERNMVRVCAVYKRSAAEYFLSPILNAQGQFIFQNAPYKDLVGFYFRTPLNEDPTARGYAQPEMAYFFNAPLDYGVQLGQGPGGLFYPPTAEASMLGFASPLSAYFYYNYGVGGPLGPGFGPPSLRHDPDPFRRWRRQAVMKALLVKCCTPASCTALDFIRVDKEYNICEK